MICMCILKCVYIYVYMYVVLPSPPVPRLSPVQVSRLVPNLCSCSLFVFLGRRSFCLLWLPRLLSLGFTVQLLPRFLPIHGKC